ncbi:MAG: nucleoside monophosphate kinase, partial [Proteobacteria bacterium]|nr:nucleoside monophosphate kinase [Pseudomonadota bacterium]
EALEVMGEKNGHKADAVIMLNVKDSVLISRIKQRVKESAGAEVRSDDTVTVLKNRLAAYREWTAPIIPFYEERGLLHKVDGMLPVHQVTEAIEMIVAETEKN